MEQKINLLRLTNLSIENFRGFDATGKISFHNRLTVLIGANGAGKTSILEAIAKLFAVYHGKILQPGQPVVVEETLLEPDDINNQSSSCKITADIDLEYADVEFPDLEQPDDDLHHQPKLEDGELQYKQEQLTWSLQSDIKGFMSEEDDLSPLVRFALSLNIYLRAKAPVSIPFAVYYNSSVSLSAKLGKLSYRPFKRISPFDALEDALTPKSLDFEPLYRWFRWQEQRKNPEANAIFEHIKTAIVSILNDEEDTTHTFTHLFVDWENNEDGDLCIQKGNQVLKINQLSAGEKRLVFLVANLAYRLATANPVSANPISEGRAIVLIDEIDLHLHPRWQQKVVPQLLKIFANCQFVVTTHSAEVLGEIPNDQRSAYILSEEGIDLLTYSGGLSMTNILTRIFGVRQRAKSAQKDMDNLLALVEDEKDEEALLLLKQLQQKYGEKDETLLEIASYLH